VANVKLDASGIPKGPVYDSATPVVHRSGVTAVDSADPGDASPGVDTAGYQLCRFDLDIGGVGFTSLTVQVLFWSSRQGVWFGGDSRQLTATGRHSLVVEGRGAVLFLKVTAFSGTSFTLNVDHVLC
jgi:hypothetical protein